MAQAGVADADVHGEAREATDEAPPKPPLAQRARGWVQKHRRALPWVALAVVVLAAVAYLVLRYLATFETTDDAQIDGDASVIAARVAGTVLAVHVRDNDRVEPGAPLVDLDPADYDVALSAAKANLEQAKYHQLAEARANEHLAMRELERSRRLFASGAIPPEDLDARQTTAATRSAEVRASQAAVDAAEAALEQARLNLAYTHVTAPVAGIVGQKHVNVGDRVQPAQELLAIVQVDNVWITANFKETQLRQLRVGQRADVDVDALGRTFRGHVESLPGASGARFSLLPPENATGNYVKVVQRLPVRIRLEPNQEGLDRLRPGMSVEPKVWLK